jgi:Zn-dependent M32 family carboxypeptidase
MNTESHDPRDIPILTEAVEKDGRSYTSLDAKSVHAAVVTETLNLADSLLHQAAKDIEATLFERVFDQLRAQLPELVDRVLREHTGEPAAAKDPADTGN